jgi:undecaprenyl diphosphate synthase
MVREVMSPVERAGENEVSEERRDLAESRQGYSFHSYADLLRQNSWTGHLPDVDLVIRTGSGADPHNSAGFLSLLTDNAQFAFLDTLWPDFTPDHLNKVLDDFVARERRMGK